MLSVKIVTMIEGIPQQLDFEGERHDVNSGISIESVVGRAWREITEPLGSGYFVYKEGSAFIVCTEDKLNATKKAFVAGVTKSGYLANPQLIVDIDTNGRSAVTEIDIKRNWRFLEDYFPWERVNISAIGAAFNQYIELLDKKSIELNLGGKKVVPSRVRKLVLRWGINT